jgi:hypothetical protein
MEGNELSIQFFDLRESADAIELLRKTEWSARFVPNPGG